MTVGAKVPVVTSSTIQSSEGSDTSNRGVVMLRFPAKVYGVIDYCDKNDAAVASWDDKGTSFVIKDRTSFERKYLVESYWGSQNGDIMFESFQRQLNSYGFKKVNNRRGAKKNSVSGQISFLVYHHKNLQKDRPDLLGKIEISDVNAVANKKTRNQTKKESRDNDLRRIELKVDELNEKFGKLIALLGDNNRYQLVPSANEQNHEETQNSSNARAISGSRNGITPREVINDCCLQNNSNGDKTEVLNLSERADTASNVPDAIGVSGNGKFSIGETHEAFVLDLEGRDGSHHDIDDIFSSDDEDGGHQIVNNSHQPQRKRLRSSMTLAMLLAIGMLVALCAIFIRPSDRSNISDKTTLSIDSPSDVVDESVGGGQISMNENAEGDQIPIAEIIPGSTQAPTLGPSLY